jgi:hypothetical protein
VPSKLKEERKPEWRVFFFLTKKQFTVVKLKKKIEVWGLISV